MPFNKETNIEHKKGLAVKALFFVAGFSLALAILVMSAHVGQRSCKRKMSTSDYKYISSAIPCTQDDKISEHYDTDLKAKLQDYIDDATTRKMTKHVSVYHYDLRDGSWFGINENEKFYPSSLLKIPIVMAVMEESEKSFDYLFTKVKYEGVDTGLVQHFEPEEKLEVGKIYTIGELAEKTIKYSNNEAAFVLSDIVGNKKLQTIYEDIGIPLPGPNEENFVSVREYITFFKVLFNGAYLSHGSSEAILSLLTKTTFNDGLVAGVPSTVPVAHKFGERTDEKTDGLQLHDCGIVYVPEKPYILCVMTRGSDFKQLSEIIKNVSKIVYENVKK
jgi:beta-lactamase class A